jgi:signal transduction histidine kinase
MLAQIARMQRLVDDMSAVSKAEERQLDLDLHPAPLTALAGDAVAAAQAQYDAAGVGLRLATGKGAPTVTVDAHRLGEVLANLLGNALRHSHPGGEVTVRVGVRDGHPVIDVSDTGDGFPPAQAERLFERFYRGDTARRRDRAGSGIGLTLARSVLTAHHGTLRGHSDGPGRGATFTVTLPVTDRRTPRDAPR